MAIVGEKINDYVIDEINIRQKKLGNTTKSDSDLVYFNAKTAWVKLASGVEVKNDKLKELSVTNYLIDGISEGKDLAEKFVLFGGSAQKDGEILNQRQGLGGDFDSYSFNPEFGVVPFPGLDNVSIKCLNRGSLEKAKIKISVSTQHQLEIIDILYLRLGYTLLLEWGNSHYLDENGILQSTPTTLIEKEFFNYPLNSSFIDLLPKIEKLRKETNGNYDGFVGKVSNFDWSFNDDGSYDVNLELISLGDVIESLKSNVILDYKTNEFIDQSTSGSANLTLVGDSTINNNKTTNTLFSILYLWKYTNSNPLDNYPNLNAYLASYANKTLSTSYYLSGNNINDYVGDICETPSDSTYTFSQKKITVQIEVGYHNFQTNNQNTKNSSYNYITELGHFQMDTPLKATYTFEPTVGNISKKQIINDNILTQPSSGSGGQIFDGDLTWDEFKYWIQWSDITDGGIPQRNFTVEDTGIDDSFVDKLTSKSQIKILLFHPYTTTTNTPTYILGKIPIGNLNNLSLSTTLSYGSQGRNRINKKIDGYNFFIDGGSQDESSDAWFEQSTKKMTTTLYSWYKSNKTRDRIYLPRAKSLDLRSSFTGSSFGGIKEFSVQNPEFKSSIPDKERPDLPHIKIKIIEGTPTSSVTISNPLRKFKEKDVFRLYTSNNDNQQVFKYYMRFGAILQVFKDEIISKQKINSNEDDYPNIVGINNIDNPSHKNFVSYMQNKPNLTSFDISKCIVNSSISIPLSGSNDYAAHSFFGGGAKNSTNLKEWEIDRTSANSMNVYINFDYIGNILESNTDKEGSISVFSFLKGICDGINRSFANINNLEPVVSKTTNILSIVDSSNNRAKGGDEYELNPFGFIKNNTEGSFVRKVDLKTAITPQYATMVTVGATAGGYVKGVEATAFARWNDGITDRFNTELLPASKDAKIKTTQGSIQDSFNNFFRIFTVNKDNYLLPFGITNETGARRANSLSIKNNTINKNLEIATEYFRAYSADQKDGGSIGFIPFNVNLKMDGISGIKIYNEILLNTRFLPSNYSKNLSFITTAVDHTLKNGDWETNLKLTLIPTPKKTPYTVPAKPSYIRTTAAVATGGNYITAYPSVPIVSFTSTKLSFSQTKILLKSITTDIALQKATFAILYSEASKYKVGGNYAGFNSAGGHNFAGVQTDRKANKTRGGVWGGSYTSYASQRITGQFQRVDSGNVLRFFAAFTNDKGFLEFMTNRVQSKGFDGSDGNKWVSTYINSWWSPAAKASYTVGTPTFNNKLSIFNSAIRIFNSLP